MHQIKPVVNGRQPPNAEPNNYHEKQRYYQFSIRKHARYRVHHAQALWRDNVVLALGAVTAMDTNRNRRRRVGGYWISRVYHSRNQVI